MSRRIALVTQGFDIGGGVPTVARWLRAELSARYGYAVDVHDLATSSRDRDSRQIRKPQTLLRRSLRGRYDDRGCAQPWGANLVELEPMRYRPRAELSRTLRTYDLIQVVSGSPAVAAAVIGSGPPVVLQVATTLRWEREARRRERSTRSRLWGDGMTAWASAAERRALLGADAVLVENAAMLSFVESLDVKCTVKAPPGVDTSRFTPAQGGWDAAGYLLSVCRLSDPRKRLDRLISAYAELSKSAASTPLLVLAGRGPLSSETRRRLDESGAAGRIQIREDVHPDDLAGLYRGASVFVQTSQEEGLGISVLEAMAAGLPVVAIDNAGSRESVEDEKTGYLVSQDVENVIPSVLAGRIREVLSSVGMVMGKAGRSRCETLFSTEHTLGKFVATYDALLGTQARG
jgi:glycosyltransferase involved in cell wall biosynthesis